MKRIRTVFVSINFFVVSGMLAMPVSPVVAAEVSTIAVEVTPSVIRTDGVESAYIEVHMHEPVTRVYLENVFSYFDVPADQRAAYALHDDGLDGDKVAGDLIFTGGPFRYNTSIGNPAFFYYGLDTENSPAGILTTSLSSMVKYEKQDGTIDRLLLGAYIGLLDSNIPVPDSNQMSDNILATSNLINLKSDQKYTQTQLRTISGPPNLVDATNVLYQRLPDNFDFLLYTPANLLERTPFLSAQNFTSGIFFPARIDFTGSVIPLRDDSARFGSKGYLRGVLAIDNLTRGIHSNNFLHELMHYWLVKFDYSFGINNGSHYSGRASVSGILYGDPWIDNGDGTFTRDCTLPRTYTEANNLEKYMMGFLDASAVEAIYVLQDNANAVYECGQVIQGDFNTVTIEDIQAVHGPRTPGVTDSQKTFNIGFVVESHDRFLTPTELAFYHLLATYATRPLADDVPNPFIKGANWVGINKFFGPGVQFNSDVPYLVPAAPTNVYARSKRYSVNLVWDEVTDASSYLVYRQVEGQDGFELVAEVDYPVYAGRLPYNASSVNYYVVARNQHGVGPDSETVVATPTFRQRSR